MKEIERFLLSKTGHLSDCEDAIAVTDHFACVVDGATTQSDHLWNGQTGGQIAASSICHTLSSLEPDVDAISAIKSLSEALARMYREAQLLDYLREHPLDRASSTAVIYSNVRRELWLVGDCQSLFVMNDSEPVAVTNNKRIDDINAAARALYLEAEIMQGRTVAELRQHDPGRELIKPLLQCQRVFQNPPTPSEYSYWVIDGFPVAGCGIKLVRVPDRTDAVVLASDGYPRLFPSLQQTEQFLKDVIGRDEIAPLMIRGEFKSTKGVIEGNDSYDDRAYLKIAVS